MALAASTYTFSLMPITALLIILESTIPILIPKTMITCNIPGPIMEIKTRRKSSPGMHCTASTTLCTIRSSLPPIYPVTVPIIKEITVAMVVAAKPTITEIRAPKMTRESTSRPTASAPSKNLADGGAKKLPASVSFIP
jgi:hypothetical protein